ncbi:MAG: MATE family efflux transporter [Treponema sp.]
MDNALKDKHSFIQLLKFTVPTMITLIFTSIYNVVDSLFISNCVGKEPFASVNFIIPFLICLGAVGFMFGTGGSALISKTMGEGDKEKPNQLFSLIVYVSIIIGVLLAFLGFVFLRPVASILGAKGKLLEGSVEYGRVIILSVPAFVLQFEFQSFFSTAGKPRLCLYITILAGITNIILDTFFVVVFGWGLKGAAFATVISQYIGGIIPLIYFSMPNTSFLRLSKPNFNIFALAKVCANGSSELLSQISMSFVSMLYNVQLLKYAGSDGVAAYGVLMSVGFIFHAIFIGYAVGITPIIGYQYGAKDSEELKNLLKKSFILIGCFAISMFLASLVLSIPLAFLFVGYDKNLFSMTIHAFSIFSFAFLFSGYAIFGSAFFTALNNGLVSVIISFMRTVVFEVIAVLFLPMILGINGIWASIVGTEIMAVILVFFFLSIKKKQYGY